MVRLYARVLLLVLVLVLRITRKVVPFCVHHSLVWKGWQAALSKIGYNIETPADAGLPGILPPKM